MKHCWSFFYLWTSGGLTLRRREAAHMRTPGRVATKHTTLAVAFVGLATPVARSTIWAISRSNYLKESRVALFQTLLRREDLAELAPQVVDALLPPVLSPAVLLVEEGLPAIVLCEVQGLDGRVREFQRPIVRAPKEALDTFEAPELLEEGRRRHSRPGTGTASG